MQCITKFNFLNRHILKSSSAAFHNLVSRDFLTLREFTKEEIYQFLWTAADLKKIYKCNKEYNYKPLNGISVGMIFQKLSTRTRISTETGISLMGGHACFMSPQDSHLGKNETIEDTAKVLSRFNDAVLARVYDHADLESLANHASIPIVNGLSDTYHPLQLLADLLTLQEHYGRIKGLNVAIVGDGNNNMTHSYMVACGKLGLNLKIACPRAYQPELSIVKYANELFVKNSAKLFLTTNPVEAVHNSDVIVTDTFVSMGKELDKSIRLQDFKGYQVDKNLVSIASPQWCFMHCLPRKPDEVTDEIFYDKTRSLVWDEAENRKWTVMAVFLNLLTDYKPRFPMPTFD